MYNKFLLTLNTLLLFKQKEEKKRLRYITQKRRYDAIDFEFI